MGGGLAGSRLALQLQASAFPASTCVVLERRAHPVPHAAHKVGESSVEIGAHYFDTVLGLEPHLHGEQLRKFGFRFFFSEGRRDIDQVTEIGASRFLSVPSYQIDRGIFENYLAEEAARRGVKFTDHAMVRQIDLADDAQGLHRLSWTAGRADERHCRSLDRRRLRPRRPAQAQARAWPQPNAHDAHAVWFRIGERITLDDWSDDPEWRARCTPQARWLSTNHLVGAGYWVWLIPLASGSHSVGIVADPAATTPLDTDGQLRDARCSGSRPGSRACSMRSPTSATCCRTSPSCSNFSYGCKQVFSGQRWALTGEAGLFLDPFYSPGSDFIAVGNTYICDLVAHDRAGHSVEARARLYDQIYHSFYESTLALYTDQYPLFGDPEVLPPKVIWDYTYYWGVLAQIFFQHRLTDLPVLGRVRDELQHCQQLNTRGAGLLARLVGRRAIGATRP